VIPVVRVGGPNPQQIRALTGNDVVTIASLGTILHFSVTATNDIRSPASGKAQRVLAFFYYSSADITTELRFKTSGNVIAGLPAKGAVDEIVEIYLSAAGTVKGWICYEDV